MFHKGGVYEVWSEKGKVWTSLGQLRSMITMNMGKYQQRDFSNWEVIEYEVKQVAVKEIHEVVSAKKLIEILKK